MSAISDLFHYAAEQSILPSSLCAGMRIELTFANPNKAFTSSSSSTSVTSYTISNIYILTECYSLTDAISLKINQMATQGLEIPFREYNYTRFELSNVQDFSINIQKAVSRGLYALLVPQLTSSLNVQTSDSVSPEKVYSIQKIQTRLGSIYFPSYKTSSPLEHFVFTKRCFDQYIPDGCSDSVDLVEYQKNAKGVYGQSLERGTKGLLLSGMSSNNSRSICFEGSMSDSESRVLHTFLCHVKVARVFLNNVHVAE